jgi:hypothetical protein
MPNNIEVPELPGNLIPRKPIPNPINAYPQLNIFALHINIMVNYRSIMIIQV